MLALLLAVVISEVALGLRLVRLDVPGAVIRGDPLWLNCSFELENEHLYSIKWYKNNVEFYRHLPTDRPPSHKYDIPGIFVDLFRSNLGNVYLYRSDLETEGYYRCEISGEAPLFQTERAEKEIRVFVLPESNPTVSGSKRQYEIGDEVNVTCHCSPSKPGAMLKWYLNGKEVAQRRENAQNTVAHSDGLISASLSLRFIAKPEHFWNGVMKFRCSAAITQEYTLSSEEIIISNNARASSLHAGPATEGPVITGSQLRYNIGDAVNMNCTSGKSMPPARLRWFINDKEASPDLMVAYPQMNYYNGQTASILGLRFAVQPHHFQKGEMRLKCTAGLARVVNLSSEETVVGSHQQTSGLHASENAVIGSNGKRLLPAVLTPILIVLALAFLR